MLAFIVVELMEISIPSMRPLGLNICTHSYCLQFSSIYREKIRTFAWTRHHFTHHIKTTNVSSRYVGETHKTQPPFDQRLSAIEPLVFV